MNLKDVALLKWDDLQEDRFKFKRSKTRRTSKKPRIIEVFLDAYHVDIIDRYGTNKRSQYVFLSSTLLQHH
ncbi:MAG: hypothetical protein IPK94_20995 [Saprospiraceae bacterium]|nr:hypothetical protein [Saprospiraceae bacterium]